MTDNITNTVNYIPVAGFTYISAGLTVNFTNTSTAGATYSWSFGMAAFLPHQILRIPCRSRIIHRYRYCKSNGCGSDFYSDDRGGTGC